MMQKTNYPSGIGCILWSQKGVMLMKLNNVHGIIVRNRQVWSNSAFGFTDTRITDEHILCPQTRVHSKSACIVVSFTVRSTNWLIRMRTACWANTFGCSLTKWSVLNTVRVMRTIVCLTRLFDDLYSLSVWRVGNDCLNAIKIVEVNPNDGSVESEETFSHRL